MARAVGDVDLQWVADQQLTISLASLASDTGLVIGRESTAFVFSGLDNVEDAFLSGRITLGTTPTVSKNVEIWVAAPIDDTPTWPTGIAGTGDAGATIASLNVKNTAMKLAHVITSDATSDRVYPIAPISIASLFGGKLPERIVVWVVHNTAVNFNATGGNHVITITPVFSNMKLS